MLEKMVFSMELHAGNDPAWLDQLPELKAGALDYADKILKDLEELGMLPPVTKATPEDCTNTAFLDDFTNTGFSDEPYFIVNRWDEE